MRRTMLLAVVLFLASSTAQADEKADRVKKLKEQIAEAEKKVAELRKELANEEPEVKFTPAKDALFSSGVPEVHTSGSLAENAHYVVEVIDDNTAAVRIGLKASGLIVIIRGVSTKGWVDDMPVISEGDWGVIGTGKYRGKTVFGLRPLNGASLVKASVGRQPVFPSTDNSSSRPRRVWP